MRARSAAYLMREAMNHQWPIMAHEAMCRTRRVLVEERLECEKKGTGYKWKQLAIECVACIGAHLEQQRTNRRDVERAVSAQLCHMDHRLQQAIA